MKRALAGISIVGIVLILTVSLSYWIHSNLSEPVYAAAVAWDGGGDATSWSDGANWDGDEHVPNTDDDVTIDAAVTVDIAASTTINSLILGNAGGTNVAVLNFTYDAVGGSALTIDDGNLTVHPAADITHTAITSSVYIDGQTGDADIDGTINTNGK